MAVMSLVRVSATYSVPLAPRATPVGPWMKAALLARQGKPLPTTAAPVMAGGAPAGRETSMRTMVHSPLGAVTTARTGRLRSLATKMEAPVDVVVAVMSHGPLMSALVHVST